MRTTVQPAYVRLGKRIRQRRHEYGMTLEELGSRIGLTRQSVNNIELGRQRILFHLIYTIAKALKCNAVDLLDEPKRGTV